MKTPEPSALTSLIDQAAILRPISPEAAQDYEARNHFELLARTVPWVYRAYCSHGFSFDYFPSNEQ